ncbi:uncharacterized protein CIMG_12088 [Coccidioides immitis RS]|uniref:Uncharacterized protein n=1 Tax=Coccidioides immitis (strain RS) TaxID=246410 RepID=A0A0D8JU14_COCIM|nr:uncharacterized protein CIMG_12088 [Coccidioides immitis RS]KJF60840.1 hypothetical protein CIMG_12088 [Coccidioides immitis RS]
MESSLGSDTTFFAGPSPKHILQGRIHTRPPIHEGKRKEKGIAKAGRNTTMRVFPSWRQTCGPRISVSQAITFMWTARLREVHMGRTELSVLAIPYYSMSFLLIFTGLSNKLVFLTLGVVEPETALGQTGEFCNHTPVRQGDVWAGDLPSKHATKQGYNEKAECMSSIDLAMVDWDSADGHWSIEDFFCVAPTVTDDHRQKVAAVRQPSEKTTSRKL